MGQDLIKLREQVMDRADKALAAVWPARMGDDYVREMQLAVGELERIADEMRKDGIDPIEQCRTYCHIGCVYSDLGPALGKEMLLKSRKAFQAAEILLEKHPDELQRAKLNFNFGNTLRQIDPNDIEQLQEAKKRLQAARDHFTIHAPQYLPQVEAGLQSIEDLLRIAPLANAVKQNTDDMDALQKQLAAGGNVSEIAKKTQKILKRNGGAAGIIGQLQIIIDTLSKDQKQSGKFADIQKQMQDLTKQFMGNNEMTPEVKQIWSLLAERLKSEAGSGKVSKDRAKALGDVLEEFGRTLSGDEKDVHALLTKLQRMREFIDGKFEMTHYLSHGIERPPAESRASKLVELNWQLRRYLLEEMTRSEKGVDESKEALDLSMRASRVDKRIYEAGADNAKAMDIEKEELCPLALAIRNFSSRMNTMPARPIWGFANVSVDTNAVFYSGQIKERTFIKAVCRCLGLEVIDEPKGESYASARWEQIQKAITTVFDLRVAEGPDMASVTYELGIALTLGRPVVVLIAEDQRMPFDVDIDPVVLAGGPNDNDAIAAAIDRSVVWTYPRPGKDVSLKIIEYILSIYQRPHQNIYVDKTLGMLANLREAPDPLAITRTLAKLFDYLKDGKTMLIHPWWPPDYPGENKQRLFHVMPYRPDWAKMVASSTRKVCKKAGVSYIRGDEVAEPNVIHSIWEEIARATHVFVDLTGFNANVALELGIAHTLGKKIMMVGQGDPASHVFKSVNKFRVLSYDINKIEETLGREIREFLSSVQ